MAPFNFIVLWTWYILGFAAFLYAFGGTRPDQAARTVLLSGSYSLGTTVIASNLCAGSLFARGDTESFAICDAVGVAAGAATEALFVHFTFTDREWDFVRKVPESSRNGVLHTGSSYLDELKTCITKLKERALAVARR